MRPNGERLRKPNSVCYRFRICSSVHGFEPKVTGGYGGDGGSCRPRKVRTRIRHRRYVGLRARIRDCLRARILTVCVGLRARLSAKRPPNAS